MTGAVWLAATLAVLRGQVPVETKAIRGSSGTTHCGRWYSVQWDELERYGWVTRLVCIRVPEHDGEHENRDGWMWSDSRAPHKRRRARR